MPEAPACVQNAMMTKDKKPFTYTPGGIDLSQIKSPRMARRIERNANSEGVTNTPKPSPLAQQQQVCSNESETIELHWKQILYYLGGSAITETHNGGKCNGNASASISRRRYAKPATPTPSTDAAEAAPGQR